MFTTGWCLPQSANRSSERAITRFEFTGMEGGICDSTSKIRIPYTCPSFICVGRKPKTLKVYTYSVNPCYHYCCCCCYFYQYLVLILYCKIDKFRVLCRCIKLQYTSNKNEILQSHKILAVFPDCSACGSVHQHDSLPTHLRSTINKLYSLPTNYLSISLFIAVLVIQVNLSYKTQYRPLLK